jgi:hypothetical protein
MAVVDLYLLNAGTRRVTEFACGRLCSGLPLAVVLFFRKRAERQIFPLKKSVYKTPGQLLTETYRNHGAGNSVM